MVQQWANPASVVDNSSSLMSMSQQSKSKIVLLWISRTDCGKAVH
jgi:hypothetical protein